MKFLRVKGKKSHGRLINIHNKHLQNQKQLLDKWATSRKVYSGDTTMDTFMGAGKQNHNRHVRPAVRKDA